MARSDPLKELVRDLPPDLEREVEDFIRFILHRQEQSGETEAEDRRPRFDWAGALSHLEDTSSVDRQHETLDEWGG